MSDTPPCYRWPMTGPIQMPDSSLPYTYVAHAETNNGSDPLMSVSLTIIPSGDGEVACPSVSVIEDSITARMNGGVAGRDYTVNLVMTTLSGNAFQVEIDFPIGKPAGAVFPPPDPPSAGFGPPVTWAFAPSFDFSEPRNSWMVPLV